MSEISVPWNHIYYDPKTQDLGTKPISGRPTTDVKSPAKAALTWEAPMFQAQNMPHSGGINIVAADLSARRIKGDPKEFDWWATHSFEGWDSDDPPRIHRLISDVHQDRIVRSLYTQARLCPDPVDLAFDKSLQRR